MRVTPSPRNLKDSVTVVKGNDRSSSAPAGADLSVKSPPLRGRVATSFWSLADQGVVSLGNFATVLLLGRKLSPDALGTYGVILGALLFLNNVQASLINYPLSVHGATSDGLNLRRLTWGSILLTALLLLPMALAITWATRAMKVLELAPWIIATLILWQFQETLRRALMSQLRYRDAIWGDALSYLGQAGLVGALIWRRHSGLSWIFAAMALTSALGGAGAVDTDQSDCDVHDGSCARARDCWDLGRWTALSNLAGVINIQVVMWTLVASHGAAEGGKLLALGTILGLTHPALFSVGNLIVPASASTSIGRLRRSEKDRDHLRSDRRLAGDSLLPAADRETRPGAAPALRFRARRTWSWECRCVFSLSRTSSRTSARCKARC